MSVGEVIINVIGEDDEKVIRYIEKFHIRSYREGAQVGELDKILDRLVDKHPGLHWTWHVWKP